MSSSADRVRIIGTEEIAQRYDVSPAIDVRDALFRDRLKGDGQFSDPGDMPGLEKTVESYFEVGHRSAQRLAELAARYHADHGRRRISLLEFASGHGCVSRHLGKLAEFELTACDTDPEAVSFLEQELGARALLAPRDPQEFLTLRYDVICALSFFTHMPPASWARWLEALYYHLERNGILVFATAGRTAHARSGRKRLDPEGFVFVPVSEGESVPAGATGSMIVTPAWVMDRIDGCPNAELVRFEADAGLEGHDLWIVRKTGTSFARTAPADRAALLDTIEGMRRSTSWRITAPLRAAIARVRGGAG